MTAFDPRQLPLLEPHSVRFILADIPRRNFVQVDYPRAEFEQRIPVMVAQFAPTLKGLTDHRAFFGTALDGEFMRLSKARAKVVQHEVMTRIIEFACLEVLASTPIQAFNQAVCKLVYRNHIHGEAQSHTACVGFAFEEDLYNRIVHEQRRHKGLPVFPEPTGAPRGRLQ